MSNKRRTLASLMVQLLVTWGEWRRGCELGSKALRSTLGSLGSGGGIAGSRPPAGADIPRDIVLVERLLFEMEDALPRSGKRYRQAIEDKYLKIKEVDGYLLHRAVGAMVKLWAGLDKNRHLGIAELQFD